MRVIRWIGWIPRRTTHHATAPSTAATIGEADDLDEDQLADRVVDVVERQRGDEQRPSGLSDTHTR